MIEQISRLAKLLLLLAILVALNSAMILVLVIQNIHQREDIYRLQWELKLQDAHQHNYDWSNVG